MIGIDLGGTRIKGVVVDQEGNVQYQSLMPTNDGEDAVWKGVVAEVVEDLLLKSAKQNTTVGISAPGLPNQEYTAIGFMPGRMQGLENFIWKDHLNQPTYVLNDAVAALVAESKFGAARGKKNVALLTLGTGVGGAMLVEGKPYGGYFNKAGHFGHMAIEASGDVDVTGMPGSLEECCGNCTIEKRTEGKFKSTYDLLQAYRAGDGFAKEVWLTSVKHLAVGLASIANIFSPELIVLGGGIVEANEDLFNPLEEFMSIYEWRPGGSKVAIVKAKYGEIAGAIGAACFANDQNK